MDFNRSCGGQQKSCEDSGFLIIMQRPRLPDRCFVIFILQSLQLFKNSLPDPCVLGNTIRRIGNKRNHETAIITRLLTMHMQ